MKLSDKELQLTRQTTQKPISTAGGVDNSRLGILGEIRRKPALCAWIYSWTVPLKFHYTVWRDEPCKEGLHVHI